MTTTRAARAAHDTRDFATAWCATGVVIAYSATATTLART